MHQLRIKVDDMKDSFYAELIAYSISSQSMTWKVCRKFQFKIRERWYFQISSLEWEFTWN